MRRNGSVVRDLPSREGPVYRADEYKVFTELTVANVVTNGT